MNRNRICLKCNEVFTPHWKTQQYCNKDCKRGAAVVKHRQKRQDYMHELLGGKCVICGYAKTNRALDFHHVHPETKKFRLSREGLSFSKKRVTDEAMKCVILCANCHREQQHGMIDLDLLSRILEDDMPRRLKFIAQATRN